VPDHNTLELEKSRKIKGVARLVFVEIL